MPNTEAKMSTGYSILLILLIFKYSLEDKRIKKQNSKVKDFIKIENLSMIKLSLKTFITSLSWFTTKANVNININIVIKFTRLKLFLTKTPVINRDIIDKNINNSGNIYIIVCI